MYTNQLLAEPKKSTYDVIIIGGAMLGSSVAWFLAKNAGFDGSILVIEKDPSYEFTSTSHTNSCMRQQFSAEINIKISQFGANFVKNFQEYMGGDERVPQIPFHQYGYMYLADNPIFAQTLKEAQIIQEKCGASTKHMSVDQIENDYPFYMLDDIIAANHNLIDEGYFDGNTIFDWWKRSAKENGVEYVNNEVVSIEKNSTGNYVETITLKSGEKINAGQVVNATGPRASLTARMLGIQLPVEPRKRYTFIFDAEKPLDRDLPLTIDPSGVHMRSEGQYYLAGCPPDVDPAVEYDDFTQDHNIWQEKVWPILANRIPQFESIKLLNSWAGHYAFNTLDQNAIVGPHSYIKNFLFVNGFSGHGFQQSPAMGRGIAEMITYGEYRTLDLSPFGFARIENNEPFIEKAVI
ncbi:FAD-binding oxidoreductase [Amylibacter sp.]|nr:FAD-binding oxidoreductase [Amylibacter sp.]MDA9895750.1 FAD-binding oxidoreductase [Amylibacter sp.]